MKPQVAVIMGSSSDVDVMKNALDVFKEFGIPYEVNALSAHRTPHDVVKFAMRARAKGIKIIIAAAGGAAHLAGVVAAHTNLPVIGVPIETKSLKGLDSLLSIVQMPAGVPVATVAIGETGAKNAALLAIQILGLKDKRLEREFIKYKNDLALKVRKKNRELCRTR